MENEVLPECECGITEYSNQSCIYECGKKIIMNSIHVMIFKCISLSEQKLNIHKTKATFDEAATLSSLLKRYVCK